MIDRLLRLIDVETRRVSTSRGALFVRVSAASDERPVLFVHGFGRGGAQLLPLALAFREARPLLVPDLFDLGGVSRSLRGVTNVLEHADALAELLDEYGPADVVGISFGGWVASWLAARHPDRVASLFLVNPAGLREGAEELDVLYRSTAEAPQLYRRVVGGAPFLGIPGLSRVLERGFGRVLGDPRIGRFLDTVEDGHFLDHALGAITCPTFALLSENDALLPVRATAAALLANVQHIDGKWILGASHNVGYEAFEVVAEELASFLAPGRPVSSAIVRAAAHLTVPPELRSLRAEGSHA